jgi:RNase P/RNase MRP subunit p29
MCFNLSEYNVSEFKPIDHNPFEKFYGKVVRVKVKDDPRGIAGRVAVLTDRIMELSHKDGRRTVIRIDEIAVISSVAGVS